MRLDQYLVAEGYFESRNRAVDAIRAGHVTVGGRPAKPAMRVGTGEAVAVAAGKYYVSRAARKLEGYLSAHPLEIAGKRALDIGASTGGFTQILLEQGAAWVDCVDVGRGQLHAMLRHDARVGVHEETDIRRYAAEPYALIVSDVSFISLMHLVETIDRLAVHGGTLIVLFKPQFEVGRDARRDRRGVVTDPAAVREAMARFEAAAAGAGWRMAHKVPSPLVGKAGNQEWVYRWIKA